MSGNWLLCVAVLQVIVQVARYASLVVMEAMRGKADSGRDALHVLAQDMVSCLYRPDQRAVAHVERRAVAHVRAQAGGWLCRGGSAGNRSWDKLHSL